MSTAQPPAGAPTLAGHLAILRADHWVKNVFALPGVVVALTVAVQAPWEGLALRLLLAAASLCLTASSNYVLNEILDAPTDREHPTKFRRPVPSGRVSVPWAYAQWLGTMALGLVLGTWVSPGFFWTMVGLWTMGVVYNVRPLRSKELPYVDVLTESINNPLRLLAGWYAVDPGVFPPGSLLLSYWMVGSYFMAVKRFAEYRFIRDHERAVAYRASFARYTEERLLTSVLFYAVAATLFFGIFIARYRYELILSFPFVALVLAVYLAVGLRPDSPAQRPEELHREPALVVACLLCALVMGLLLVVEVPLIDELLGIYPRSELRAP